MNAPAKPTKTAKTAKTVKSSKPDKSESRYRAVILAEFKGKRYFNCECCTNKLPVATSLDGHHKLPQLAGVDDRRENLAVLCINCHHTLHRFGASMSGIAKGKRPALELAEEYALAVNRQQYALVAKNMIELATLVAQAIAMKKSKQIEGGDVDTPLTLSPRLNTLFKHTAREVKDAHGKPLGKARLLQVAVGGYLIERHPALREEINDFVMEVLGHPPRPKVEPIFMGVTRL